MLNACLRTLTGWGGAAVEGGGDEEVRVKGKVLIPVAHDNMKRYIDIYCQYTIFDLIVYRNEKYMVSNLTYRPYGLIIYQSAPLKIMTQILPYL